LPLPTLLMGAGSPTRRVTVKIESQGGGAKVTARVEKVCWYGGIRGGFITRRKYLKGS
jgi:hypothetical protein